MSHGLNPSQDQNFLQRLSADNKSPASNENVKNLQILSAAYFFLTQQDFFFKFQAEWHLIRVL